MNLFLSAKRKVLTEIVPQERTETKRLFLMSPRLNPVGKNTMLVADVSMPVMHFMDVRQTPEVTSYRMRWDDITFTILECTSECSDFMRWLSHHMDGKKVQARSFDFTKAYDDGTPKRACFILYGCLPKFVVQSSYGIHVILSVNNFVWEQG